jgi:hypothetical protein
MTIGHSPGTAVVSDRQQICSGAVAARQQGSTAQCRIRVHETRSIDVISDGGSHVDPHH